jgi:hypothetical protein
MRTEGVFSNSSKPACVKDSILGFIVPFIAIGISYVLSSKYFKYGVSA